jgi:type IV secretion system protein VirB11
MSALTRAAERNLRFLLAPIQDLLGDPAMTNLYINGVGDGQCFVSRGHGVERLTLPFTFGELEDIAVNAAALRQQDIAEDVPVVDTVFPDGQRVNIVRPPAVPAGTMSFSIRRPSARTMSPLELEEQGVFAHVAIGTTRTKRESNTERLLDLYRAGRWREFIELAIACKLNLVWSGSVDAGKTHSMRSFTHAIPADWRIVTVEDTPELIDLPCPNTVHLLYSKGMQSAARVSSTDLVEAALRMGIQGLLVQELRDEAAFSYVKGLESGHWGMTTTHAESAEDVFSRIAGLVKQHPAGMHRLEQDILATLRRNIHVIVHYAKGVDGDPDLRHAEEVYWAPGLRTDDQMEIVAA